MNIEASIEQLLKESAADVDKLIDDSNVVGAPITVGDSTIIPLMQSGFAFGAGGGGESKGTKGEGGEGLGEVSAGGGRIRPVAVIIVNSEGVKVAPIPGTPSGLEKLGSAIGGALQKRHEQVEATADRP